MEEGAVSSDVRKGVSVWEARKCEKKKHCFTSSGFRIISSHTTKLMKAISKVEKKKKKEKKIDIRSSL